MAVLDPQKLIPSKKEPTQQLVGINVKVIKARDLLKGTLAAKKAQFKNQKKSDQILERGESEQKLETPKEAKRAGINLSVPGKSFLANAKNFINMILLGWVATRLLKFLPHLVKILKPIASIAEFFIKVGGVILEGLIAFVDAGYKAYDWTRGKVEDKFGEEGVAKFDAFTSGLNKFMNLVLTVGMTAAAIGMAMGDQTGKGPKGKGPKIKPKGNGIDSKGNFKKVRKTRIVDVDGSIRPKTKVERVLQKQGLGDGQIRAYNKARQGGANVTNALAEAKKVKNIKPKASWWRKLTTGVADTTEKWVSNAGNALRKKWDNLTKGAVNNFNQLKKGAQEALSKQILQPFMNFLEPVTKPLLALKDTLMKQLLKIPGLETLLKKIGLNSLSDAPKLAGKFGAKALPWIGGLFNLLFAYDRFANGDSIGGILETVSGALDIAGMWPASLAIDAYLFGRDMFPETVMGGEEALIGVVPGLTGLKGKVEAITKKLPDLGTLVKMVSGGAKKEELKQTSLPAGTGTTPINVSAVQKRDGEIGSISISASYDQNEVTVVEVAGPMVSSSMSSSKGGLDVTLEVNDSGGDSFSDFSYKKGG